MNELIKDDFSSNWILIARSREKYKKDKFKKKSKPKCPFCPGSDDLIPKIIIQKGRGSNWRVRVFPNKYPSFSPELEFKQGKNKMPAYGRSEILVETPKHDTDFRELSVNDITEVLEVMRDRTNELLFDKAIKYVSIIKNEGGRAGASIKHTHSQIFASPVIPARLENEMRKLTKNKCRLCSILKEKKNVILENDDFTAYCPDYSRVPYETWIACKKHKKNLEEFNDSELKNLAVILKKILKKVCSITPDYNFSIHSNPKGKDFHFHIEILPKTNVPAGLEIGDNTWINHLDPKDAAKELKKS